jgi:hypothetical protein
VTGEAFKPGYDALIQNLTSGSVNASSLSSQQSNCTTKFGNGDLGTKVGVGAGVPLGVLVAGLLGFLFYREYRKGHTKGGAVAVPTQEYSSPMAEHSTMNTQTPTYTSGYQDQTPSIAAQQPYSPHIPKSNLYTPAPTAPVYEAPATNVHEMGSR